MAWAEENGIDVGPPDAFDDDEHDEGCRCICQDGGPCFSLGRRKRPKPTPPRSPRVLEVIKRSQRGVAAWKL